MTPVPDVAHLKSVEIPALLVSRETDAIGQFGRLADSDALEEASNLLEANATGRLASGIEGIVSVLAMANPERVGASPSFVDRLLGRHIERSVRYQHARESLDARIYDADVHADFVRQAINAINKLIALHEHEVAWISAHLEAGRQFLDENADAGVVMDQVLQFERPRERFVRKLGNLATLLASHEMSLAQMKMAKAQAVSMLDSYHETVRVLVPVWRQHTLALITAKNMSPEMVRAASTAHRALMASLAGALDKHHN